MSDERAPIQMVRRGSFLAPYTPFDSEQLERFSAGKVLRVRVSQARSAKQLRLYRAMLNLVVANLDQEVTDDALHEWMKLKLGYTMPIRQRNGDIVHVPASVAFDKMDQPTFQRFFDEAKRMVQVHLIPGLNSAHLEREIYAMLGEAV